MRKRCVVANLDKNPWKQCYLFLTSFSTFTLQHPQEISTTPICLESSGANVVLEPIFCWYLSDLSRFQLLKCSKPGEVPNKQIFWSIFLERHQQSKTHNSLGLQQLICARINSFFSGICRGFRLERLFVYTARGFSFAKCIKPWEVQTYFLKT